HSFPFPGLTLYLTSAAFQPGTTVLFAISADGKGYFWDTQTGNLLRTFPQIYGQKVLFSPSGRLLLTTHWSRPTLWDTQTGQILYSFPDGPLDSSAFPTAISFSPDEET